MFFFVLLSVTFTTAMSEVIGIYGEALPSIIHYAQPVLDYTPIVVESDYEIPIGIEVVDDCEVEEDEIFTVEIVTCRRDAGRKRRAVGGAITLFGAYFVIKDNDGRKYYAYHANSTV